MKLSQVIWYLKIPENSYSFKEEKNLENLGFLLFYPNFQPFTLLISMLN